MNQRRRLPLTVLCVTLLIASCSRENDRADAGKDRSTSRPNPTSPVPGPGRAKATPSKSVPHALEGSPSLRWANTNGKTGGEWMQRYTSASSIEEKSNVIQSKLAEGPENLGPLLKSALLDPDEQHRIEAVLASTMLRESDDIADVFSAATHDTSQEVRDYALTMANEIINPEGKLAFFERALRNPLPEIRQHALTELGRSSSKEGFAIMLEGLRDSDPAFRDTVNTQLQPLIGGEQKRTFESYEDARQWWKHNERHYDENMMFVGE